MTDKFLKILFFVILVLALNSACGIPGADPKKTSASSNLIDLNNSVKLNAFGKADGDYSIQSYDYSVKNCIYLHEGALVWWRDDYSSTENRLSSMSKVIDLTKAREIHLSTLRNFKKNPIDASSVETLAEKLENDPSYPDCDLLFDPDACDPEGVKKHEKLSVEIEVKENAEIESAERLREIHQYAKVEPIDARSRFLIKGSRNIEMDLFFKQDLESFKKDENDVIGLWFRNNSESPVFRPSHSQVSDSGRKLVLTLETDFKTLELSMRRYDYKALNTVSLKGDVKIMNKAGEIIRKGKISFEGENKSCE